MVSQPFWVSTYDAQETHNFLTSSEARLGKLQAQGIFPVDPTAHGVRSLTIGQGVSKLHDGDDSEAPWRLRRLPTVGIESSKDRIIIERPQLIPHLHKSGGAWKGGLGQPFQHRHCWTSCQNVDP